MSGASLGDRGGGDSQGSNPGVRNPLRSLPQPLEVVAVEAQRAGGPRLDRVQLPAREQEVVGAEQHGRRAGDGVQAEQLVYLW